MEGIFVTGTDTGVGKTTVCAGLLRLLAEKGEGAYWKPVQTGTVIGDDTQEVQSLTDLGPEYFLEPGYRYPEPAAPWIASRHLPTSVELKSLVETRRQYENFLIVEGAGGLLVPMTEDVLQVELVQALELPVVLVSQDKLGTINQTLLTVRACREFGLNLLGVIMTKSSGSHRLGNSECISKFGDVEILAEIPESLDRMSAITNITRHPRLRELFDLTSLPI